MAEHINFKRKRGGRVVRVEAGSSAAKRMGGLNNVWTEVDDDVQTVEEVARPDVEVGELPAVGGGDVEPPAKSASKAEWVDHAVAKGADRDEAEAATKADLVEQYG